jgi:small conductance mechanosensitive channel
MDKLLAALRTALWSDAVAQWGARIAVAALIVAIGLWLSARIARVVGRAIDRRGDQTLARFLRRVVYVALSVLVMVVALDALGLPTTTLLAALGAAGLAVGLALRDSLANLASGVLLVLSRPFKVGDFVQADGREGTVERIDLVQTILISPENHVIVLPNGQVMNSAIVNYTARPLRRIELAFQLPYDVDIAAALATVQAAVAADVRVQREPAPQLLLRALGTSAMDLVARAWVPTEHNWVTSSELLQAVTVALDRAGLEFPAPKLDVRVVAGAGPAPMAGA